MSGEGGGYGMGNVFASLFLGAALIFGVKTYQLTHRGAPEISTPYESNAVPMSYVDQCGEAPVCVWWWQYLDSPQDPGWQLHYGPQAHVPADARPARSLPVLCDPNPCRPPKKSAPWWQVWR